MIPKYKIGDELVAPCGYTGKVDSISIRKNGIYYYGGAAALGIGYEHEVRLKGEPQPLKLFAYRVLGQNDILYSLKSNIDAEYLIRCSGQDRLYTLQTTEEGNEIELGLDTMKATRG
jgi:hypothetical protein